MSPDFPVPLYIERRQGLAKHVERVQHPRQAEVAQGRLLFLLLGFFLPLFFLHRRMLER